jgi:hypothetical protein
MRLRPIYVLALVAVSLAGCGGHSMTLNVDVHSFLSPADVETSIEPHVPPTPTPGLWLSEDTFPPLVDDKHIQLVSGAGDIVDVRSVTFRIAVEAADSTGAGADTLRIYLSSPVEAPRTGVPVLVVPMRFAPPVAPASVAIDTVSITLDQSPAVAELFTGNEIRLSVTNAVRGPVGTPGVDPDLSGRIRLLQLDATVVATHRGI